MFVKYYSVASKTIKIAADWEPQTDFFAGFETREPEGGMDVLIELYEGRKLFNRCYGFEYHTVSGGQCVFLSGVSPEIRMTVNKAGDRIIIENCKINSKAVFELILVGFYSYIVNRGGVLLHASLVDIGGEGIAFTADSGVGKTTQAVLWEKYMGAEILNGDKVILECDKNGRVYAWGSPWKGSSPYGINKKTKLKAIVVLGQGKYNKITRLDTASSSALFLPHVFYPYWNESGVESLMNSLDICMRNVSVYHLVCKPDEEAVSITKERIWKLSNG